MPQRKYPNSRLHLTPLQSELIKKLFWDRGYPNARTIATTLYKAKTCADAYTSEISFYSYVRSVLNGNRGIPYPMIEGIIELFENDERIQFLREQPKSEVPYRYKSKLIQRAYHNDTWDKALLSHYDTIRDNYFPLKPEDKMVVLSGLEDLIGLLATNPNNIGKK